MFYDRIRAEFVFNQLQIRTEWIISQLMDSQIEIFHRVYTNTVDLDEAIKDLKSLDHHQMKVQTLLTPGLMERSNILFTMYVLSIAHLTDMNM